MSVASYVTPFDLAFGDEAFKPAERSTGNSVGLDVLPDGEYQVEIVKTLTKKTKKGEALFIMVVKVIGGDKDGTECERPSFLKSQQALDIVGRELMILGFDVDQWTVKNGRPFSQEFLKAIPHMIGLQFRGEKKTSPGRTANEKAFHNLYVNERVLADGKPAKFTREDLNKATADVPF